MSFDTHMRRGHPIVFGLIIFFGIIEGAISTWLIDRYTHVGGYPDNAVRIRTGFICFTSWWTVLFSILFIAFFQHSASTGSALTSVGTHGVWLFITWVFWTAGAASITAALGGGVNCSNIDYDLVYCNQLVAEEAFAWVEFILFTFALIVVFISGHRAISRGDGFKGQLVAY